MNRTGALATLVCATVVVLGCSKETSRGPVAWSASNPAAPRGQDEDQLWARATSNDHYPLPSPPEAGPSAPQPPPVAGRIALPQGAALVATTTVDSVEAFPEEAQNAESRPTGEAHLALHGVARVYDAPQPYGESVDFVQRALAQAGCDDLRQTTTSTATIWSVRCRGERAHVAIRNTRPTTIEVIETGVQDSPPASGVTNAQPPSPPTR